ncbi:MAG: hypothetical protein H6811_06410 [Phycisphaeraceae bacterium]|nr:hypothetical protein [Phycisphaeraceae bacterium]
MPFSAQERQALMRIAARLRSVLVLAEPSARLRSMLDSPSFAAPRPGLNLLGAETDAGTARVAEMIVSPAVHVGVFEERRRQVAKERWEQFLASQGAGDDADLNRRFAAGRTPFSVDLKTGSVTYGALRDGGRPVHAGLRMRAVIALDDPEDEQREAVLAMGSESGALGTAATVVAAVLGTAVVPEEGESGLVGFAPVGGLGPFVGPVKRVAEFVVAAAEELRRVPAVARRLANEQPPVGFEVAELERADRETLPAISSMSELAMGAAR